MTESPTPSDDPQPSPDASGDAAASKPDTQPQDKPKSEQRANRRQFFALLAGMGIDQMEKKNEKAKSLLDRFLYPDEDKNSRNQEPSINPVDAGEPDDDAWYRDRLELEKARAELWADDYDDEDDDEEAFDASQHNDEVEALPVLSGPEESVRRGSFVEDETQYSEDEEDVPPAEESFDVENYVAPDDEDAEEDPVK